MYIHENMFQDRKKGGSSLQKQQGKMVLTSLPKNYILAKPDITQLPTLKNRIRSYSIVHGIGNTPFTAISISKQLVCVVK